MGNSHSRSRFLDMAREAHENARPLRYEIDGPRCKSALIRYLEGSLDAEALVKKITPLEVSFIPQVTYGYSQVLIYLTPRSTSSCG